MERIHVKVFDIRRKHPVLEFQAESADDALKEFMRWAWKHYPQICNRIFGGIVKWASPKSKSE